MKGEIKGVYLTIRKMQVKTTMCYHHTKIEETDNAKCWRGCRETESFTHWCV